MNLIYSGSSKMLDIFRNPEPLASLSSKMSVILTIGYSLILAAILVFCWYRWKLMKAYEQFPVKCLDTKWLPRLVTGRYPKDIPLTRFVFSEIMEAVKKFQAEGLCVIWFLRPYLFIYNEEFIKAFCNDHALVNRSKMYDISKEIFGNGIIGREGEMWKIHRKLLNPVFYTGVLKGKMAIFNKNAKDLVEKLQNVDNKPIEKLTHLIKNCNFNIMLESVLGLKFDDEKHVSKAQHFMKMLVRGTKLSFERLPFPWLHWGSLLPYFPSGKKYIEAVREIHHFTYEVIEELQKSAIESEREEPCLEEQTETQESMAQILYKQHLQDPSLTIEDMRDHLSNIIIASFDTTTVGLMWCFYLLGHHPEIQEKAYKEVESVVPEEDLTSDHLGKLKYLDCVIKETLRLYPPLPFYARKISKDFQCGKYTVPKGTDIIFSPFLLHRNPHIYAQPEKFDPERFNGTSETRAWLHIPFAEGYRSCLGKKFAMMEMKVLLVYVLKHFRVTTLNKIEDSDLTWAMVLKPTKRIRMLFEARTHSS